MKRLFALSRNRCAYPKCETPIVNPKTDTIIGDICHIKAHNSGGPRYDPNQTEEERHAFENLLLLCKVCHRIVDDRPDIHTVELLRELKEMHERNGDIELSVDAARMAQRLYAASHVSIQASDNAQVMVASPGAIQAQQVVIKTTKRKAPSVLPTQGAIGHNLAKRNYTLHLMERYNDFQKWDASKSGVGKYIVLGRAIKKEFGAKWDLVPESQFFRVIAFIQKRILNSKLGRIKNSRGEKSFSTWEEWQQEHFGSEPH
ncbi:MAG: HNH endonuclease [Planctomycetes bacterium]|nr:HNH endonuclease [Planctomycetota bacterium]